MKNTLIVFAKEPEKGKVKTKFKNVFTDAECQELYKAFIKDTIDIAENVQCDKKILAFSCTGSPRFLEDNSGSLVLYEQVGRDLGEKVMDSFDFAKQNGAEKTVIIGSDSPTLPYSFVEGAFKRLDSNDIVLGPTYSGGYYLIGVKEPFSELFKNVVWGTDKILDQTIHNAKSYGKTMTFLNRWYCINKGEDLMHIKRASNNSYGKHTKDWLNKKKEM